jgi:hypothetical protein
MRVGIDMEGFGPGEERNEKNQAGGRMFEGKARKGDAPIPSSCSPSQTK